MTAMIAPYYYLIPAILFSIAAVALQTWSIAAGRKMLSKTNGTISSAADLKLVRSSINSNILAAFGYKAIFLLFALLLVVLMLNGMSVIKSLAQLSVFGIITLPASIIRKAYEERIRHMRMGTSDQGIKDSHTKDLLQWKRSWLKLPEEDK